MPKCTNCRKSISESQRFCPHCGTANASSDNANVDPPATEMLPNSGPKPKRAGTDKPRQAKGSENVSRKSSFTGSSSDVTSDSVPCRFPPGTMLDDRFRIVGPIGRGGMGEVYRADDLKLGQSVALKFLPENLSFDRERMDLLYNEVRLARSVSHPNVCRVYDIGEIDGLHFLSMEYIDGEDLGSLLRRIGRLPEDKGVEIARQICSGLYAAHERGVIHLDLKPSNIMIDGRGKVRITDFGLARLTESTGNRGGIVGTPAYMAPEQLAGGNVGEHSDIYSLGLILHEVFTGKPVYRASSVAELLRIRDQSAPSRLSGFVKDLDPAIEKIIQRCLDNDALHRPGNVVQIAAALPGGDPLAAALAAGETPSPELVAASGGSGGCSPRQGLILLSLFVAIMIGSVFLTQRVSRVTQSPMTEKPEVLEARSQEISQKLMGVPAGSVRDSAYGYWYNPDQLPLSAEVLASSGDGPLEFWYRQSPKFLSPKHPFLYARQPREATLSDPSPTVNGMVGVRLTSSGLLREVCLVPSLAREQAAAEAELPSDAWEQAFRWAGLDFSDYSDADVLWSPPWDADQSFAWKPKDEANRELPRVEAATQNGQVCYFQVIFPWTTRQWTLPSRDQATLTVDSTRQNNIGEIAQNMVLFLIGGPLLVISMLLAVRNLRIGSTDKQGALKYAGFMLIIDFTLGLLEAHHNSSPGVEMTTILSALIYSLGRTVRFWIYYLALEPYVRKTWPRVLVSWNRFINGGFTNPSVAKEILLGCIFGAVGACLVSVTVLLSEGIGQSMMSRNLVHPNFMLGGRAALTGVFSVIQSALPAVFTMIVLVVFRLVTRIDWLAALGFICVFTYISSNSGDTIWTFLSIAVFEVVIVIVALRVGLLALLVFNLIQAFLTWFPVTFDVNEWYFSVGLVGIITPLAIAVTCFFLSLGDKSPLRMSNSPMDV